MITPVYFVSNTKIDLVLLEKDFVYNWLSSYWCVFLNLYLSTLLFIVRILHYIYWCWHTFWEFMYDSKQKKVQLLTLEECPGWYYEMYNKLFKFAQNIMDLSFLKFLTYWYVTTTTNSNIFLIYKAHCHILFT